MNPGDAADDSPFYGMSDSSMIAVGQNVCAAVPVSDSILAIYSKSGLQRFVSDEDAQSALAVAAIVHLCPERVDTWESVTGVNLPG